jgi:hypothetical protein
MPDMLPTGVEISVSRRSLPAEYRMPTMDMSVDHYSIGLLLAGDRRTITPLQFRRAALPVSSEAGRSAQRPYRTRTEE